LPFGRTVQFPKLIFAENNQVGLRADFEASWDPIQGCQMVYFQTKNPNLGKFWRACEWKMLYFITIWNILRPFGIIYGRLV
jgi:hypothetical protein